MKVIEYKEKDVPQFQKEVCPNCVAKGRCIKEGKDNHWFLMCPNYHQWKLGYSSFVGDWIKWQCEHPEENEKLQQAKIEKAKKWKDEQKRTKSVTKCTKSKKA